MPLVLSISVSVAESQNAEINIGWPALPVHSLTRNDQTGSTTGLHSALCEVICTLKCMKNWDLKTKEWTSSSVDMQAVKYMHISSHLCKDKHDVFQVNIPVIAAYGCAFTLCYRTPVTNLCSWLKSAIMSKGQHTNCNKTTCIATIICVKIKWLACHKWNTAQADKG